MNRESITRNWDVERKENTFFVESIERQKSGQLIKYVVEVARFVITIGWATDGIMNETLFERLVG